jgi:hypothetical protein
MPKKNGRPTIYSQELADRICEELAIGRSMRSVCLDEEMPAISTVFNWLRTDENFLAQYARAKEESADALYEETQDIADESLNGALSADPKAAGAVVQSYRLRVDTRKWMMSKQKPKKYGDKLDLTSKGDKLPTPLLNVVRNNDRNEQDTGIEEED